MSPVLDSRVADVDLNAPEVLEEPYDGVRRESGQACHRYTQ